MADGDSGTGRDYRGQAVLNQNGVECVVKVTDFRWQPGRRGYHHQDLAWLEYERVVAEQEPQQRCVQSAGFPEPP
jgi:hypothetical protein